MCSRDNVTEMDMEVKKLQVMKCKCIGNIYIDSKSTSENYRTCSWINKEKFSTWMNRY